ncbi:hypothetical protein [Mycobacterium sp.]|uniref:hypothetical protein n=1 Tax=Mycobacterium sp. TaxID=1785 RepID=UPI0012803056|nr:hypothetical protein [Mycobacterium sp.]KAA8969718.1 MAG: hypothetical protein F6Q13_02100 [Mycobacterium sp.]
MSSPKHSWLTLFILASAAVSSQLTPPAAHAELHNITYIAQADGVAPGAQVTFLIHDNETGTATLGAIPGTPFEAHTVLTDPDKAGMQVSIPWPYSATVRCEIDVDDAVATQVDRFVKPGSNDPDSGVLACGAPLPT